MSTTDSPTPAQPLGRKATRYLVCLNLLISWAQITVIIALLVYSSKHPSPQSPDISEWRACDKLGILNVLWAVAMALHSSIALWSYRLGRPVETGIICLFAIFSLLWLNLSAIFLFTPVGPCHRFAAPRIWWLTFTILLLIYLVIIWTLLMLVVCIAIRIICWLTSHDHAKHSYRVRRFMGPVFFLVPVVGNFYNLPPRGPEPAIEKGDNGTEA